MISPRLYGIVECPECRGAVAPVDNVHAACATCGRRFDVSRGYLDLRPAATFAEQTKYLDEALHADARHEAIAPPLLGSKIRNDMLRRFLRPGPGDRVIDLGCGNGRAMAWNQTSGAALCGIDISPYFAPDAIVHSDLVLGDLRRLPLKDRVFNKAWSLDVLEHLSPQAFRDVLLEAGRVLTDDGRLFVYTHVRRNGWPAIGVRAVNRLASVLERRGWLDLRQERLRKSDHLNPIADHAELRQVVAECGFEIERITYYTPVMGAFVENVLARVAERWMARRAEQGSGRSSIDAVTASRMARTSAQARVRRRGLVYRVLVATTAVMKADIALFGGTPSGPFFALLRKKPHATRQLPTMDRPWSP
jgi:SAM-dependent methyltransferase